MTIDETLVIIRPLSIARGHGPDILSDILDHCQVNLTKLRRWVVCDTTLHALGDFYIKDNKYARYKGDAWICLFSTRTLGINSLDSITDYCGPSDMVKWDKHHLRYRYSSWKTQGLTTNPDDTVVYIADPTRLSFIKDLLF